MDYKTELHKIEKTVNDRKIEAIKAQEQKNLLTAEKTRNLEELKKFNLTENELSDKINELEIEIQTEIQKCQELLK